MESSDSCPSSRTPAAESSAPSQRQRQPGAIPRGRDREPEAIAALDDLDQAAWPRAARHVRAPLVAAGPREQQWRQQPRRAGASLGEAGIGTLELAPRRIAPRGVAHRAMKDRDRVAVEVVDDGKRR